MKKRVLALVLGMIMCLSIVFTSCSLGGKDMFDVRKDTPVNTGVELGATPTSDFEVKGTIIKKNAYYVATSELNAETQKTTYTLYSVATKAAVKTITVDAAPKTGYTDGAVLAPDFVLSDDEYAAVVENKYYEEAEDKKVTITVYNAKGEQAVQLANVELEGAALIVYDEHILVNEILYKVNENKDGVTYDVVVDFAKTTINKSSFTGEFIYTGKEYVHIGDDSVTTFDDTFAAKAYIETPEYANAESNAIVLRNGNILIQYMIYVPADASDYDVYDADEYAKIKIENKLLKANSGKLSDVKYNDMIVGAAFEIDYDDENCIYDIADDCILAGAVKVVDGLIEEKMTTVIVNNNGKVTEVEEIDGYKRFEVVSEDKFFVSFDYGSYLYNSKGKVIATFTEAPLFFTKSYIVFEDKITTYDDMETSVRTIADEETVLGVMYNDLIFIKKTIEGDEKTPTKYNYTVYGASAINYTSESSANPFTFPSKNYFAIREVSVVEGGEGKADVTTTTVTYYNAVGTKLYSYSNSNSVDSKTTTTVEIAEDAEAGILVIFETKTTKNDNAEPTVVKTVKAFTEVVAE